MKLYRYLLLLEIVIIINYVYYIEIYIFNFSYFDTPEERYNILRGNVSDITCIQLGLSIFTYDINSKTFKSCAYTIYTYPQTFLKSDSVVHFQTACVEFLSKHQFDFNKVNIIY